MPDIMGEPDLTRVIRYLARERSAAAPKIAFDLRMTSASVTAVLRRLRNMGLVKQITACPERSIDFQDDVAPPSISAYYILSEHGLEILRRMEGRSSWVL